MKNPFKKKKPLIRFVENQTKNDIVNLIFNNAVILNITYTGQHNTVNGLVNCYSIIFHY